MNLTPNYRTAGVREDGATTAQAEHLSMSVATDHVRSLRASGLVAQMWIRDGKRWLPYSIR